MLRSTTDKRRRRRVALRAAVAAALIIGVSGAPASAQARPDSLLQQDVDHIRDVGTVGVLAESAREADGDTLVTRARSGTSTLGGAEPVPWGSHVRIGSTTKTMVATVLLQLEAEGRLSLDDSVERWLPLRFTNELVWNALCGYDTDPGPILASRGARGRPAVLGVR